MANGAQADEREETRTLLVKISAAWRQGRLEEVAEYFHDDMVIRGPELQEMGRGREVCVGSYKDFISQATAQELKESDAEIDVWGNAAVASYAWEMHYEMGGASYHESGRDLFVFKRDGGKWLAVWRAVLVSPAA
ncbi:MAG TPA: nuclear transport factor 2 family protein [Terriglobia bacterium]|nr:nuclear transport factor 2 family protein [Terriglobia bacterium]